MLYDVLALLFCNLAHGERAIRLKRIDSGHVVALLRAEGGAVNLPHAGLDGATVDDDSRPVVADSSHQASRHVLVTSGPGISAEDRKKGVRITNPGIEMLAS